jgi:cytochrome b involved in lipid metabolism
MSPSSTAVVTALLVGCAASFTSSPALFQGPRQSLANNKLYATTLEPPTSIKNKNGATAPPLSRPTGVDAPVVTDTGAAAIVESREAATGTKTTTTLDVRIHDIWYDLSKWRTAHPAGSHWIDYYDKRDATEVMDAFHSAKARQMYQRLPHSKSVPENVPAVSAVQRAFRALQVRLEEEGYWERNMVHEATQLSLWASCVIGAVFFAQTNGMFHNDFLSISLLGMSMTAAGWLGHDYIHGVDDFANRMRNFAALAAGLTPTWWSDKHNKVRHYIPVASRDVDETHQPPILNFLFVSASRLDQ